MKGEEGDKVTGPLFPRLHVNDTDKGGPRAPPRNKMALYEQLCVPSQRFNSSSSALPFPPHNSNDLVPSLSSSQGFGQQRKMLSPFHMTCQMPVHSAEKARTSDGMNLVGKRMELERKPIKQVSSENLFGTGFASECRSQRQENSSMKISCEKILDAAEDIVDRTFDQLDSVAFLKKDTHKITPGLTTSVSHKIQKSLTSGNSSCQATNLDKKLLEDTDMAGIRLRSCHETFIGDLKEISPIEKTKKTKEKSPSNKITYLRNSSKNSFVRTNTNSFCFENFVNGKMVLCQENGDLSSSHTLDDIAISNGDKSLEAKSELFPKLPPRKSYRTSSLSRNCFNEDNAKRNELLVYNDAEKQDDDDDDPYEPSMAETVPSLDMSPDDIIAVIGAKNFWKARTAIANQQRLFEMQVFELHRLIKVQKLIAASPHLLLEGRHYLSQPSVRALHSANKEPQCNNKRRDDLSKINHNVEQPIEDGIARVPVLPACVERSKGRPQDQVPQIGPHSVVPSAVPIFPNEKPSSWCFPPLANQWLVPVMSPSEGLVYKPYSGHCPPPGSFMPHISGGCTHAGDFMNSAYGVPVSHQPPNMVLPGPPAMLPHYFPTPCGLRPSKPIISSSAVEQVCNLSGSHPDGKSGQLSMGSHNMFHHPRKEAIPGDLGKFQVSKTSELQGSTISSPSEKARREGGSQAPPIAAAPTASRDSQTHVIKVVPHNAMSATESAARIFLSIQKERQRTNRDQ